MSPIKDLTIIYEALNPEDTISQGDTIEGTVRFTLKKETKVKSLLVKIKGDASVHWTEGTGDDKRSYSDHRRYFKDKKYLVAENSGTVLPQGDHSYKFKFQIPQGHMPSSFKGVHGQIIYMLEAKISRSWRLPSTVHKELNFVSKSSPHHGQVMCPQSGSLDKEIGVFSKGQVQISATVNRKVCSPGDTLSVSAKICNSSSKTMKPKFSLQKKIVYRAGSSTNVSDQCLCKVVGENLITNSEETVSCQLMVPADVIPSLNDCEIITVEYYVKVYLDISFAFDPEVRFPLIIVPASLASLYPVEALGPYPPGTIGGPSYSDFPAPAFPPGPGPGPYPAPAGPSPYGYPAADPTQHAYTPSGYNTQWPQQAPAYGFPTAPCPPPSVQPQAPSAPPLFQQGEPPSYTSIYPNPNDSFISP